MPDVGLTPCWTAAATRHVQQGEVKEKICGTTTYKGGMMKKIAISVAVFSMLFSLAQASHAEKMLSGDEIKALITNKTVDVSLPNGSKKWRQHFAADGSSARDNGQKSEWNIDGDKHCNTAASNAPCAGIRDNGDGTYSRVNDSGEAVVNWTKIVDGKDF